jgi:hypothetical protein
MALQRNIWQEIKVYLWVMVPYVLFTNILIQGGCILQGWGFLGINFLGTGLYLFLAYILFVNLAAKIRNRYPKVSDLFRRVIILLPINYIINMVAIYGIYYIYPLTKGILCEAIPGMEGYAIVFGCVIGTMFTFIIEGMANWDRWKQSLAESEKLRNAYQRSKLLGLKGQINPHFLFNCFNTLSSLITVDKEEAEEFLNEMTKVHRYMLRSDDEYLVTLADEMKFAHSYLSLTKSRFGTAVHATIDIQPVDLEKQVPPLTLQAVLENIIYTNALNKQQPLTIHIASNGKQLRIDHTLHEKKVVLPLHEDDGLDNLVHKYRLLNQEEIQIIESPVQREIVIPLFDTKTLVHETA